MDVVAPDPQDILHELLDDLGEVRDVDFLIGNSSMLVFTINYYMSCLMTSGKSVTLTSSLVIPTCLFSLLITSLAA